MVRACARMGTGSSGAMPRPTVSHQGGFVMHKLAIGSLILSPRHLRVGHREYWGTEASATG